MTPENTLRKQQFMTATVAVAGVACNSNIEHTSSPFIVLSATVV